MRTSIKILAKLRLQTRFLKDFVAVEFTLIIDLFGVIFSLESHFLNLI